MFNVEFLYEHYASSLQRQTPQRVPKILNEFKYFIANLKKMENQAPFRMKYTSHHLNMLLEVLSEPLSHQKVKFTLLIQIVNLLLKNSDNILLICPERLFQTVAKVLVTEKVLVESPSVVSNIMWFVARCIQLSRQRLALFKRIRQSNLIEACLQCPELEPIAEKGISLILSYMNKLQLLPKEFALILTPNLPKFKNDDSKRQVLNVLRQIGLHSIKNRGELVTTLTIFLINYIQNYSVPWTDKLLYWQLYIEAAYLQPNLMDDLQIIQILKCKLLEQQPQVEGDLLKKIQELVSQLPQDHDETQALLSQTAKNLMTNPISRRIFVRHHEKMNLHTFVGILSGPIPDRLIADLEDSMENLTSLKVMICLKRSSSLLGVDSFFYYKFPKKVCEKLSETSTSISSSNELMEIWMEVFAVKQRSRPAQ